MARRGWTGKRIVGCGEGCGGGESGQGLELRGVWRDGGERRDGAGGEETGGKTRALWGVEGGKGRGKGREEGGEGWVEG